MSVVLPQPFAPSRTRRSPLYTSISNESRIFLPPALNTKPRPLITGEPTVCGLFSGSITRSQRRTASLSALIVTFLSFIHMTLLTYGLTTSSLCSTSSTAYPLLASERSAPSRTCAPSTSRFASGSSRIMIFCFIASVEAVISLCFCPPDIVRVFASGDIFIIFVLASIRRSIVSTGISRFSHPKAISSRTIS